jgi:hypothetical protein
LVGSLYIHEIPLCSFAPGLYEHLEKARSRFGRYPVKNKLAHDEKQLSLCPICTREYTGILPALSIFGKDAE